MARQDISVNIGGNRKTKDWKDYCKDGDDWKCLSLDGSKDFSDQIDAFEEKYKNPFNITPSIRGDLKDIWKGLQDDEKKGRNNNNNNNNDDKDPITKGDEPPPYVGKNSDGDYLTQAEFDLYAQSTRDANKHAYAMELQNSINAGSLAIQQLTNEASAYGWDTQQAINTESEAANSWRTQYAYDAQERWNKYDSAMDYKAVVDAEKIRGEYGNSLAAIMQAGNESVAKIRGEYNNAGIQLQGEYNVAGEKIRGNAARDVAQRNKEAAMFGSFLGGFWS